MKNFFTLKSLLVLLCCFVSFNMKAQAKFIVDGIKYDSWIGTSSNTALVIKNDYTGDIVIPGSVSYNGIKYDVTSIDKEAFENCFSLTSVTLPEGIRYIKDFAFKNCIRLTSITLPNSLTSIGNNAFNACKSITSITIPKSVVSIDSWVFSSCSSLASVTIQCNITEIPACMFLSCSSLTSITIPNSIMSIGGYSFEGCSSLTSITIPNSVTSIGNGAFRGCSSLTSITIPNSVTLIGNEAFSSCVGLTSIVSSNPEPPKANQSPFINVGVNKCKIYVPKGSKQKYTEAVGWDQFNYIIESADLGDITVNLSISNSESGLFKFILSKGDVFKTIITPADGWEINTVTFNGIDVTSELDANNQYTTPPLTSDSELKVSHKSISTNVEQIKSNSIKVHSDAGAIVVKGAKQGENIKVYTTSGSQINTTTVNNEVVKIKAPTNQIYIVNIGQSNYKVAL